MTYVDRTWHNHRDIHGQNLASILACPAIEPGITLGMSPPEDHTRPKTKRVREVVAAAKGPAKETSNRSVWFFTKLLN